MRRRGRGEVRSKKKKGEMKRERELRDRNLVCVRRTHGDQEFRMRSSNFDLGGKQNSSLSVYDPIGEPAGDWGPCGESLGPSM